MSTIDTTRRRIFKGSVAASALGFTGIVQFFTMSSASADWPAAAFDAENMDDFMKAMFTEPATDSTDINLKVPDIAENGAVVPVTVSSSIDNVRSVAIVVPGNPSPLVASFDLGEGAVADVSTRMKMGTTSDVIAFVQTADNKLFATKKEVKVTIGGCGG